MVGLLNALGEKCKDIRNALEYVRRDLTVDIIHSPLLNRELELRSEHKEVFHVENTSSNTKTQVKGMSNFSKANYDRDKNLIQRG